MRLLRITPIVIVGALVAILLSGCEEQIRTVGRSMEPAIRSGELVGLDPEAYAVSTPERGDIIALRPPIGSDRDECAVEPRHGQPCRRATVELTSEALMIKRIIGVPSDRIAFDRLGIAIVNGERLDEWYAMACLVSDECFLPTAIRVPRGHYYVVGDNRPYSSDSRLWGPIPARSIEGRVRLPRP